MHRVPFEPFWIELTSGKELAVPHPDHVFVGRFRVVVEDDRGVMNVLSGRHISRLRWQEREQSA